MHVAAEYGLYNLSEVMFSSSGDLDANSKNGLGRAPLALAAGQGHAEIVKLLLAKEGIDVNFKNIDGRTPLLCAATHRDFEVVQLLLAMEGIDINSDDSFDWTLLLHAVHDEHLEVAKLLLKNKASTFDWTLP